MKDIQAGTEGFPKIAINKVGVRNIELPVTIHRPHSLETFSTVAQMSSYCDLVEDLKGINMSRISRTLVPIFTQNKGYVTDLSTRAVKELKAAHQTDHIYLKLKFKYTWDSASPETCIDSPEIANVEIETKMEGKKIRQYMTVETVGMSLCPCSKEMSLLTNNLTEAEKKIFDGWKKNADDKWPAMQTIVKKLEMAGFGAHNQKSYVRITVELKDNHLYIEDLIDLVNECVSAQTYSILKRPDEKYVTEVSYMSAFIDENKELIPLEGFGPKFVEDIVRQVGDKLNGLIDDDMIEDYVVVVRNEESIHSQDIEAVAVLNAGRDLR